MSGYADRFDAVYTWIFVSVFVFLALAIIVGFVLLDAHPALFFPVIIIGGFIVIVAAILGNAYDTSSESDALADQASNMGVMDWFMDNFAFAMGVFLFLGFFALFARLRAGWFRCPRGYIYIVW